LIFVALSTITRNMRRLVAGSVERAMNRLVGRGGGSMGILVGIGVTVAVQSSSITTSILVPLVVSFGIDPIHFGIILIVTIEIAFLTPPLGVNLFVASQIANIKFERVAVAILPFVFTLIVSMLLVIFFPQISLWLPETLRSLR
jgi:TRAP-type C4-dicarboxylate transport system permease large subunit